MFKSVYSKYIAVFLSIVLIGFLTLALILTSLIASYSTNSKREQILNNTKMLSEYIQNNFKKNNIQDFNQYIFYQKENLRDIMNMLSADNEESIVLVCAEDGSVLLSNAWDDYYKKSVGTSVANDIIHDDSFLKLTDLNGLLEKRNLVSGNKLVNTRGETIGVLLVCSASTRLEGLIDNMNRVILIATVWVMLATVVVVYFISRRIVYPLKQMSEAAKSFSLGKFDVRVPVHGNNEVAELAIAFNNMAASLSEIEEMRRSFLANVSHELRTPMTSISGFIDGMLCGAIPKENFDHYLRIISDEVKRLSRLISCLLDITRMQAGERKIVFSVFDICETARQILISFEQKIEAKHLNVEFVCDKDNTYVSADKDAIYQVIYNLCDNAIKFSKENGLFKISIVIKDKKVYFSVYNEGVGIGEKDLPFVFDRFYKTDKSHGLDKSGVGLGLYIVKTIVDAHNEEIWVRSKYGEYCEFVFTVEYARLPAKSNKFVR